MKRKIEIEYIETIDLEQLSKIEKELMTKAINVANTAYAPYSEFNVGAALILENDKIITGNNQENSSFPCGICAERVALFSANSMYPNLEIKKIAITAIANNFILTHPVGPCGLCRQVLIECEERQNTEIEIILFDSNKIIKLQNAKSLLPFYFKEDQLKRKKP
ncbi:MAG: cytidine deaminase [Flavobacteriales bacterium]|nr:cytidine deaminase [Flavobacteriales bacterium]